MASRLKWFLFSVACVLILVMVPLISRVGIAAFWQDRLETNLTYDQVYELLPGFPKESDNGAQDFRFKNAKLYLLEVPEKLEDPEDGSEINIVVIKDTMQPGTLRIVTKKGSALVYRGKSWGSSTGTRIEYNPF